jgi:hypothetical protein
MSYGMVNRYVEAEGMSVRSWMGPTPLSCNYVRKSQDCMRESYGFL